MRFSPRLSHCSNVRDVCLILPSRYGLAWMTSISKPSKQNSSTCTRCEMMTGEDSSGLATPKVHMKPPLSLLRQHNRLLYRNSHPLVLNLPLLHLLFAMLKDGN